MRDLILSYLMFEIGMVLLIAAIMGTVILLVFFYGFLQAIAKLGVPAGDHAAPPNY